MWPIFHGLNEWHINELKPASNGENKEDLHVTQDNVLESLGKAMIGEMKEGYVGALATEDPEADGYYAVRFKSVPYTLIRQTKLTELIPTVVVGEGAIATSCASKSNPDSGSG
jgi:hypothetical protein